jgi:hypothetical protein
MNLKQEVQEKIYIEALRNIGPEKRLLRAIELSEFTRALFKENLKKTFPELNDNELHELYLKRLALCQNRNY